MAALLIGGGTPLALAAPCAYQITNAFDNPGGHVATNVCVKNTSFTGNITNEGTISPSGITLQSGTISGLISSSGTIYGGISIDSNSEISSGGIAVLISGPMTGGISNAGAISGLSRGIVVTSVAYFGGASAGGGITNSGTISAANGNAIVVNNVGNFSGGISNSGTITAKTFGIGLGSISTFVGGISNSGTILAGTAAISASGVSTFSGGISNSGTISAAAGGLEATSISNFSGGIANSGSISSLVGMSANSVSTFSGGMTNSGVISGTGMRVENVATFNGGITNTGTISGGKTGINAQDVKLFTGGMTNTGKISARTSGMYAFQVSTFTGGMTNSGTILVAASGAMFAISLSTFMGGITNTGTLIGAGTIAGGGGSGIDVNFVSLFTGGITTSGTVSGGAVGIGLFNNGTFQGGIANSGTVRSNRLGISVSSVAQFGSASNGGGITNSGTISAGHTGVFIKNDGTFVGGLVNSGTITAAQAGLSISFVSMFTGGVTNSGVIAGNIGIIVGPNVSTFSGAISNSGNITGTGGIAIDVSGANNAITINQQGGTVSGEIKLSANADVLNITGGTIAGNIVGSGSSETVNFALGSGSFIYSSPYGFSGVNQVNVNSGSVVLNGSNSATAVDVLGGTLAGTGTLASTVTIHSGGTFAPGVPGTPGTSMTITGNLAFESGAIYLVQVNSATSSMANVSGTATLAGDVLAAFAPGNYLQKTYDILHSGGLNSSTFGNLDYTNLPAGFIANLSYTTTDVYLNLKGVLGSSGGLSNNQSNVANTLNNFFNNGGTLTPNFLTVFGLTGSNLTTALSQLSGEAATGAQQSSFQMMSQFLGLIVDPFASGRSGSQGVSGFAAEQQQASLPPDIALAYASALKSPASQSATAGFDQRWSAWGQAYGGYLTANGNAAVGSNNLTSGTHGVAGGIDYRLTPDTTVGFALAGGGTNWNLAQGLGGGRSDAFQAGIYGTTHYGPAYLSGSLAAANYFMTTNRIAVGDVLTAGFDAQGYGGRLEGGYRYGMGAFGPAASGITPYVALQTQWFHTPGYRETDLNGGGFALAFNARTSDDTRGELGVRFDSLQSFQDMPLLLRARLAYAHDWVGTPAMSASFELLPGTSFLVNGAALPRDSALTTASAALQLTRNWSIEAKFDGQFANTIQVYAGTGTLRYRW